eukprot:6194001-Pleurochrysis_carterae.AAC.2
MGLLQQDPRTGRAQCVCVSRVTLTAYGQLARRRGAEMQVCSSHRKSAPTSFKSARPSSRAYISLSSCDGGCADAHEMGGIVSPPEVVVGMWRLFGRGRLLVRGPRGVLRRWRGGAGRLRVEVDGWHVRVVVVTVHVGVGAEVCAHLVGVGVGVACGGGALGGEARKGEGRRAEQLTRD